MRTLYVSYFGLREPLVQSQVLPYLREVGRGGTELYLLTFEPRLRWSWSAEELREARARLAEEGIRWFTLPYHKRPTLPATLYDVAAGAWTAARLVRRHGIDTVHARGHIPAVMGAAVKRMTGARLLFDIRGLLAEEYVDAGVWPEGGMLYRMVKRAERGLLDTSDGFVVLTERVREALFPGCSDVDRNGRPIEVIPCCVDRRRFEIADGLSRASAKQAIGLSDRRVLIYVGALGGIYLTREMAEFLAEAYEADRSAFFLFLTKSAPGLIAEPLRELGIPEENYRVQAAAPTDVPRYLRAADLALSFRKPTSSQIAASPTKIAEYLVSGLPVICNAGVGDMDTVIEGDRVGVLLREFSRPAYRQVLELADALRTDPGLPERCMACARDRFDLAEVGGIKYRRLYERLNETIEPGQRFVRTQSH